MVDLVFYYSDYGGGLQGSLVDGVVEVGVGAGVAVWDGGCLWEGVCLFLFCTFVPFMLFRLKAYILQLSRYRGKNKVRLHKHLYLTILRKDLVALLVITIKVIGVNARGVY